jgi:hypothetical protein
MLKIIYLLISLPDLIESMTDLVDSLRLLGSLLLQVIPTLI